MTPLFRTVIQRRALTIGARARAAVRNLESQAFERNSFVQDSAKADWGRQARHIGGAAVL